LAWPESFTIEHGWVLEPGGRVDEGEAETIFRIQATETDPACLPSKLLIPWRFFRLWALADGIDPPENMVRCMANNYSALGFWRSWHRSYNLWVIRYEMTFFVCSRVS
jgi:hypothetical protein